MTKDGYLRFLASALIQVNAGIIPPEKVLMWMDKESTPEGLHQTVAALRFWLEGAEAGKISARQLRHNLGYWLMGNMNYTDALGLEFVSDYFRGAADGSR